MDILDDEKPHDGHDVWHAEGVMIFLIKEKEKRKKLKGVLGFGDSQ